MTVTPAARWIVLPLTLLCVVACRTPERGERGTTAEAQALVARAIAVWRQDPVPRTFARFNDPEGEFRDRDLYIFVLGTDGTTRSHGMNPSLIRRDVLDMTDVDGKLIIREILERATPEGAWVDYKWQDPLTNEVFAKSSWVVREGDLIFGSGVYRR